MPTKQANAFISRKIKILKAEGYPQKQSVAISINLARKKGYKINLK